MIWLDHLKMNLIRTETLLIVLGNGTEQITFPVQGTSLVLQNKGIVHSIRTQFEFSIILPLEMTASILLVFSISSTGFADRIRISACLPGSIVPV